MLGEKTKRQMARVPVPESQTSACLIVNGRTERCQLVEMSLGGFGVMTKRLVNTRSGSIGVLHARGLEYIVEVTRQEPRGDLVLVGLRQVEEVKGDLNRLQPSRTWLTITAWSMALGIVAVAGYYSLSHLS